MSATTPRGLACGLFLYFCLPQIASAEKNCDSPSVMTHTQEWNLKDYAVQYEEIVTSDRNPPYATSTITVAAGTLTTTRTEYKTETRFGLDAGCVVSSGSSIYTLAAPATITQEGTAQVTFWVRRLCLESPLSASCLDLAKFYQTQQDPLKKPLGTRSIQKFAPKQTGTHSAVDLNKFRDYDDRPM